MLDLKQEGFSRVFDAKEARIIAIEELLPLDAVKVTLSENSDGTRSVRF